MSKQPIIPFVLFLAVTAAHADLTYKSPSGVRWTITAEGLSAIHLGERQIASGGWRLEAGHGWYKGPADDPAAASIGKKEIDVISDRVARVRHVQNDLVTEYTYTFNGEDVEIEAWVSNREGRTPLEIAHFSGLTIDFGRPPTGSMPLWHSSYTVANPESSWHPVNCRIGASWGIGDGFGIGMTPGDAFTANTMCMWEWNWSPDVREKDTKRRLRYFIKAPVQPQTARAFTLTLRISNSNTDWKHLIAPYKALFDRQNGGTLAYDRADARPLIMSVVNSAVGLITEHNRYGLHSGRRIDSPEGVEEFAKMLITGGKRANAEGVILWGQGGSDPRGAMYRPDFDVVPPEMEANLPKLAERLKAAGMTMGLTARPAEVVQRANWTSDLTNWLAPTPNNLLTLGNRFKNTMAWGTRTYYLDTFGNRIDDVAIMRSLRTVIGRDVQTYCEHGSDVILPYSGLYTELYWDAKEKKYGFAFLPLEHMEFFRWLCPEVPIAARLHFEKFWEPPAPGELSPVEFLLKHKISPLLADYQLVHHPEECARTGELVRRVVDESGHWRDNP
jgi:hypothetical protein